MVQVMCDWLYDGRIKYESDDSSGKQLYDDDLIERNKTLYNNVELKE